MKNNKYKLDKIQKKGLWIFGSFFIIVLIISILILFGNKPIGYGNVDLADLLLTFVGCIAAIFFALSTFLNLDYKKEKKLIDDYALLNFCKEVSVYTEETDKKLIIQSDKLIESESTKDQTTTICFVVTKSDKMPIYKVLFKNITFKNQTFISDNGVNGRYNENTMGRKYNSLVITIPHKIDNTKKLFSDNSEFEIELDIVSIFDVISTVKYKLKIDKEKKSTKENPDKKEYEDIATYLLHYSIYRVENQNIYEQ
jgi:hypothetical protein